MTRGRLIWPFLATVEPLDTAATEAADAGTGYDPYFKEPITRSDGTDARVYGTPVELECQVETEMDEVRELNQGNSGDDERVELKLVFHFQDLEDQGLVDASGRALIKKGDRLVQITDIDGTEIDDYSGLNLVVQHSQPRSAGLSSLRRNLLLVTFKKRKQGE